MRVVKVGRSVYEVFNCPAELYDKVWGSSIHLHGTPRYSNKFYFHKSWLEKVTEACGELGLKLNIENFKKRGF